MNVTRAFSLRQPWATIVAKGLKPVENRDYAPPKAMVGQYFAIHASKIWDKDGERYIRKEWDGYDPIEEALGDAVLVRSAIIGIARIVGYMKREDGLFYTVAGDRVVAERGHEMFKNPWFFGDFGYVLEDVREVQPIPCSGALNFWRLPEHVELELARRLVTPIASLG